MVEEQCDMAPSPLFDPGMATSPEVQTRGPNRPGKGALEGLGEGHSSEAMARRRQGRGSSDAHCAAQTAQ